MGHNISILHAIDYEIIQVWNNTHRQNFLSGQDLTIKIEQIFFDNSCK